MGPRRAETPDLRFAESNAPKECVGQRPRFMPGNVDPPAATDARLRCQSGPRIPHALIADKELNPARPELKREVTVPTKYRTYLIFGAPGSGKGTQGRTLGLIPSFFHCACGEVFRSIDTRTSLGKAYLEYSSKGELVPDEITVELWRGSIQRCVDAQQFKPETDHLVLDGIPRNVSQADLMDPFIDVKKVFHLSCPNRDKLVARLKKRAIKDNRLDDANEEVIRQRLETYQRESKPLLDRYGDGLIVNIDATEPPIVVLNTIVSHIVSERKTETDFLPDN